jgi:transcriptional regulator with XRE-family HTH domain
MLNSKGVSMKKMPRSHRRLIDKALESGGDLDSEVQNLSVGSTIRLLRKRLLMNQRELAARAQVPQSSISRIESGLIEPNFKVLKSLMSALFCQIAFIPVLSKDIELILNERAEKVARKRLEYLQGTMALEAQNPDENLIDELVSEEKERILRSESPGMWSE